MILDKFVSLAASFFISDVMTFFIYPLFALFFIVSSPCIFHRIFGR